MGMIQKTSVVAIGLCLGLLAGCSGSNNNQSSGKKTDSTSVKSTKKSVLRIGLSSSVPTLDPGVVGDTTSARVMYDLYEGLINENQKNEAVVPGVAKSWDISDDGKVYTFHLRKDAKWSNGKPVTAEDFAFSIKRTMNPATGSQNNTMLKIIKGAKDFMDGKVKSSEGVGVKAIDEHTLQITLAHPASYFLSILASSGTYPVYIPEVKKDPKGWSQKKNIVTNGAYMMTERVPNGHILAVKNPYYWDAKNVHIDSVRYLPITNPADEYNAFKSNLIDMTFTVPDGYTVEQFRKLYGKEYVNVTQLGTYSYWFNVQDPKLQDVRVRKALTMAFDRKPIVESITRLGQTPLFQPVPTGIEGGVYDNIYKTLPSYDWVGKPLKERQEEAKKLLEEVGYSAAKPLKLTLSYNTNPTHQKIALAMVQMWKEAFGKMAEFSYNNEEWKVYLQTMHNRDFQLARFSWIADYNSASNFMGQYICGSSNNNGGSCDKELGKEFALSTAATDPKVSQEHMAKAISIGMNKYYSIPIYNYTYNHLVKSKIKGYKPEDNHMDHIYSRWFSF